MDQVYWLLSETRQANFVLASVLRTFVDDLLIDGYQADIDWFLCKIKERFKCQDEEYLQGFHDKRRYRIQYDIGMKTATSTNKRHYRNQALDQDSTYREVEDFHQLEEYRRKGLSRKVNICTEARTTPSSHVDTTRQGPHTTVNGVNTVNMVNGTVNIGDFNAKNARSTHQDADESTLGLRG